MPAPYWVSYPSMVEMAGATVRSVPCGIDDKAVTSMQQELGCEVDMAEVEQKLLANLANVFDFDLVD